MSAKPTKKSANSPVPPAARVTEPILASSGQATAPAAALEAPPSWLDSSDPRKRMWGKIVFVGVWIYVAALMLLALDQTFNWGIFGPKVTPGP